ncbi:odorant receptor 13a-like isoform X3 [Diachasmimorpha longicaudata]|uniref:odorant receptor 13a-like isoform X3 n=1 Tax=Diachasmimorpha longicaudata TaxID=58733 RepID=UPI0030B91C71
MEYKEKLYLEWNENVHYALDFSKWWSKALGVWPWRPNQILCTVQASSIASIVMTAAVSSSMQLLTKGSCGVITDLLDILSGILVFSGTAVKIICLSFHQQQMRYIILSMIDDWLNINETKSSMALTTWIDPPTIKSEISQNDSAAIRHMLLAPSCWVPITMSLNVYLLYYSFMFIATFCSVLTYAGCDAFMFSAALHLCGQFEILEANIEDLSDEDNQSIQKYKIKKYSKRHNHLILLGKRMNILVSGIILSELLSNSVLICGSGIVVLATVQTGNVNRVVISWAARIYVWYMEFFMYCYVGEKIASHADRLRSIVYNCRWYNMSFHIAKDMEFMIMRNNYFCHLTGGDFLIMNHESFAKITKVMFSFFSVLRFMIEP